MSFPILEKFSLYFQCPVLALPQHVIPCQVSKDADDWLLTRVVSDGSATQRTGVGLESINFSLLGSPATLDNHDHLV